jgi:hypothetical protein
MSAYVYNDEKDIAAFFDVLDWLISV